MSAGNLLRDSRQQLNAAPPVHYPAVAELTPFFVGQGVRLSLTAAAARPFIDGRHPCLALDEHVMFSLEQDAKCPAVTPCRCLYMNQAVLAAPALMATAQDGAADCERGCTKCHGTDGKGKTKVDAKDYTDAKVQSDLTDEAAAKAIKDGKVLMKPAEGLSDADIKALVKHMRTFKK